MADQDAFLDSTLGDRQGAEQTPPPESQSPSPEPVVKQEVAAQPAPQPSEAGPTPADTPSRHVPLDVALRWRDEGTAAKRELAAARAAEAERKRKADEAAENAKRTVPDMFADPEGYHAHMERLTLERIEATKAELAAERQAERIADSEEKWSEKLGGEESEDWKALNDWLAKLPDATVAHFEAQRDPYGTAWKHFKQLREDEEARSLRGQLNGKTLDELIAEGVAKKLAEQAGQQQDQAPPAAPSPAKDQFRAPNGQFATPPQPRPSAPSLNQVEGARPPAANGASSSAFFEDTFR